MRLVRFGLLFMLLGAAKSAAAQVPAAAPVADPPAVEPAQEPPAPEPGAPAPPPESAPDPVAAPESAPAPAKIPEGAPEPKAPPPAPITRVPEVGATDKKPATPALPAWIRAHQALTVEARIGLLVRPESSAGFDDETHLGADLGLSGYLDLNREFAAGLELERASLGRGSALSGLDTVSTDFSVTSAMLGVRAYPKRTEMIDLYVGLQLGLGMQHVSSAGTRSPQPLRAAVPFSCSASDSPGFQIGGGVGARFMLSPRWGIGARLNATGRRLTSDVIDACAQGIGTATTVTASIGLGYDFDLDP